MATSLSTFTAPTSFPYPIPTQFDPNRPPPAANPIHGNLHTFPFPFFYNSPPAFPYAATYPFPPPASAYTHASGFSPNWPTWPPPSPDPTPSTATPTFSSFPASTFEAPTTIPNLFGAPAPISFPAPAHGSSVSPLQIPRVRSSNPLPSPNPPAQPCTSSLLSPQPPSLHPQRAGRSVPAHPTATLFWSCTRTRATLCPPTPSARTMQWLQQRQRKTPSATGCSANSATYRLAARLDQQQAREQDSFANIQVELEKVTSMVSQIAVSVGKKSPATASTSASSLSTPVGVSFVASTFAVVSATSAPTMPSATASVAPQVFGEMPTPNSGHGTRVIAPAYEDCCYGYPNQMQSSCVQEGSTNLSEQHLDGRSQQYGFHNLNRQSVFLADGTERSYFTLPTDYPLEQITTPISSSAVEKVSIMAPLPVAVHAAGLARVLCSSANNAAGSELMLVHEVLLQTAVQDAPNGFKEMTIYDVYEEEQQDSAQSQNCSSEPPKDALPQAVQNWHFQKMLIFMYQDASSSDNISLLHVSDMLVQVLQDSVSVNACYSTVKTTSVYWASEKGMATYFCWDPGVSSILHTMLHKYTVPNKVQFLQWTAELSFLSLTTCIQYMAANGINSALHDTPSSYQGLHIYLRVTPSVPCTATLCSKLNIAR